MTNGRKRGRIAGMAKKRADEGFDPAREPRRSEASVGIGNVLVLLVLAAILVSTCVNSIVLLRLNAGLNEIERVVRGRN